MFQLVSLVYPDSHGEIVATKVTVLSMIVAMRHRTQVSKFYNLSLVRPDEYSGVQDS